MHTIRMRLWPGATLAVLIAASPAGAQLAQSPAPSEPPVYRVESVRPPASAGQVAPSAATASDQDLADRVFVQLAQRAWAPNLQIRVDAGVVTVAGTVPSEAARRRVLRTIARTAGVVDVRDQLRVDPRLSTSASQVLVADAELAQRVARGIATALPGAKAGPDWWSSGWRVEGPGNQWNLVVEAEQGRVLLEGDVPGTDIVRLAVDSALRTPGVRGVESDLEVDRRYHTQTNRGPLYSPPYGGGTAEGRALQRSEPPTGIMPPEAPAGGPRALPPATLSPREAATVQTTMMGEVLDVDRQTGRVRVRTREGTMDLFFPMSGLQNVKPGDTLPVMIHIWESVRPAGS